MNAASFVSTAICSTSASSSSSLRPPSATGAIAHRSRTLQLERDHVFSAEFFSHFRRPSFGRLLQQQFTCVPVYSRRYPGIQEGESAYSSSLRPPSATGAIGHRSTPLQLERDHVFSAEFFSHFRRPSFGCLSQQQFTCVSASSRQYPGLQEGEGASSLSFRPPSATGAICHRSRPLQLERHHVCSAKFFSHFRWPSFGRLLQQQFICVSAYLQRYPGLQEGESGPLHYQERETAEKKYRVAFSVPITEHQTKGVPVRHVPVVFDVACCCTVFVSNVHDEVSETFLARVFRTLGPVADYRLIRNSKSSFCFVRYRDHKTAAMAISTLNGRRLFKGARIRVDWAYLRERTKNPPVNHAIFVDGLSKQVTDRVLFQSFRTYASCSVARVIRDEQRRKSKGIGFVFFKEKHDAIKAIKEMTGRFIGDKEICCGWAETKEITTKESCGRKAENIVNPAIENDLRYTTVYVGNLEHKVSRKELREIFNGLGAGLIEDVQIARYKGFGFVRYSSHDEAAAAIKAADGRIIGGRAVKCFWGTKPYIPLLLQDSVPGASQSDEELWQSLSSPEQPGEAWT